MSVITFPVHVPETHVGCQTVGCAICDGGLFCCVRCGGAEGSLPTDCPGEPMPEVVRDEVYRGQIDYRHEKGWVRGRTHHMGGEVQPFERRRRP